MILLDDVEMVNIVFLTLQQYRDTENKITTTIVNLIIKEILKKEKTIESTQDICDTILECFDMYNDFIQEKNMDFPLIDDASYDLIVNVLNSIVGEMINGD